jgi:NAD(P)-dependent dehydrogenase (short-subunit alcohol dehydrogenase family)
LTSGRLDAVVTCAGVIDAMPVEHTTLAQWERVMAVANPTGTFLVVWPPCPLCACRRAAGGV